MAHFPHWRILTSIMTLKHRAVCNLQNHLDGEQPYSEDDLEMPVTAAPDIAALGMVTPSPRPKRKKFLKPRKEWYLPDLAPGDVSKCNPLLVNKKHLLPMGPFKCSKTDAKVKHLKPLGPCPKQNGKQACGCSDLVAAGAHVQSCLRADYVQIAAGLATKL